MDNLCITSKISDARCCSIASSSMPFPHYKLHSATSIMHATQIHFTC